MMDPNEWKQKMEKSGKLEQVKSLAASEEAAAALASVNREDLQQAVDKNDPAVLRAVMEQLLSTDAGKQLARKVKAAMENG